MAVLALRIYISVLGSLRWMADGWPDPMSADVHGDRWLFWAQQINIDTDRCPGPGIQNRWLYVLAARLLPLRQMRV
jgi:hypothetical protein